ncbi:GSCFA domain-containing protein [Azospirillum sp. sgz302134]
MTNKFLSQSLDVELFRITTAPVPLILSFDTPIAGFGSCLAAEINHHAASLGFTTCYDDPHAFHYGPETLAEVLEIAASGRPHDEDDVVVLPDGGVVLYPYNMGQLRLFGEDAVPRALAMMDSHAERCREVIRKAGLLIVTLGSPRVFRLRQNGRPITRISHLPDDLWLLRLLSVDEVVATLDRIVAAVATIVGGPDRVPPMVFTVSPQRYLFAAAVRGENRDPFVDNTLCKSVLRVAIEYFLDRSAGRPFHYFPSYEMVMEELRLFDSLAHYDFQHVGRLTPPYITKRFLQTFATPDILGQLDLAVDFGAAKGEVERFLDGGLAPSDPRVLGRLEEMLARFAATPGQASPVSRRLARELAKRLSGRADGLEEAGAPVRRVLEALRAL